MGILQEECLEMVCTQLVWISFISLRLGIKQLVAQHIPLLKLYIAAISLGDCVWLHCIIITGCHNNTHCAASLSHLTPVHSWTQCWVQVLSVRKMQYPTLNISPFNPLCPYETRGQSPHCVIVLHFVNLVHVLLAVDFVIKQQFLKGLNDNVDGGA